MGRVHVRGEHPARPVPTARRHLVGQQHGDAVDQLGHGHDRRQERHLAPAQDDKRRGGCAEPAPAQRPLQRRSQSDQRVAAEAGASRAPAAKHHWRHVLSGDQDGEQQFLGFYWKHSKFSIKCKLSLRKK